MEDLKTNKEFENALVVAILSYFFKQNLLTPDEYTRIKATLNVRDTIVDNNPNKSDVYR